MDEPPSHDDRPSKTRRKKDMIALQDLGEELVRLPAGQLAKLDLPEELRAAVTEARRIRSFPALRRQMRFIGRLMRTLDAGPIAERLAAWKGENDLENARFHVLERWRDRLLADDEALTEWLTAHPDSDISQIRTLVRNARKETAEGRPPKSVRALFRLLREISEGG